MRDETSTSHKVNWSGGVCDIRGCTFEDAAVFSRLADDSGNVFPIISGDGASFAQFELDVARFTNHVSFKAARFLGDAEFFLTNFEGSLDLEQATFEGNANFVSVEFAGPCWFSGVTIRHHAEFGGDVRQHVFLRKCPFRGRCRVRHGNICARCSVRRCGVPERSLLRVNALSGACALRRGSLRAIRKVCRCDLRIRRVVR